MLCNNCGKNYREEFSTGSYCFGCNAKESFFIGSNGSKKPKREELRIVLWPLRTEDFDRLKRDWGITVRLAQQYRFQRAVDHEGNEWLYMPIFDETGREVHSQMRAWSPGCRKKYMTRSQPAPGIIWRSWNGPKHYEEIAVTEGILDAVRVGEVMPTVALMGHAINEPRLKTLRSLTERIVIVLDSDALKESLTFAREYGILVSRVVTIPAKEGKDVTDPADFETHELRRLIYGPSSSQRTA